IPLLTLTVIPLLIAITPRRWPREFQTAFFSYLFPVILVAEFCWTWTFADMGDRRLWSSVKRIDAVLRLTGKDDYVMDDKGDFIFRDRPFYWVLEPVTRYRMRLGLIRDNIVQCLEQTDTKVTYMYPAPPGSDSAKFIAANYIAFDPRLGDLGVAGKIIGSPAAGSVCAFTVCIPATYAIESETGVTKGILDGAEYKGPVYLSAGSHT